MYSSPHWAAWPGAAEALQLQLLEQSLAGIVRPQAGRKSGLRNASLYFLKYYIIWGGCALSPGHR